MIDFVVCPVCGKRAFSSRRKARLATRAVGNRTRVYYAHHAGWHVTSEVRSVVSPRERRGRMA